MSKYLEQVGEFHETFEHPINNFKNHIPLKDRELRINLIFEELQELAIASGVEDKFVENCKNAIENNKNTTDVDKKEELDALVDIQYVLSGAVLTLGFQNKFDAAFDEVHRSNMSKLCNSVEEAEDTITHHILKTDNHNIAEDDIAYKEKNGKFIVYRISDNKILKNKYYSKADLNNFVR